MAGRKDLSMQKKAAVLVALLLCGMALLLVMTDSGNVRTSVASVGRQAPDIELADLSGKIWRLSDLRGKTVLVHFWATWCSTCEEENPTLQALQTSEPAGNLTIVTVLVKDTAEKAKKYMDARNFSFPVLVDTGATAAKYGITGVPESFLIDKSGIVRDKIVGPNKWDSSEVKSALAKFGAS